MAPRLLRRLLPNRNNKPNQAQTAQQGSGSPASQVTRVKADNDCSVTDSHKESPSQELTGLWADAYNSFIASEQSQDLKAVAKSLRDISKKFGTLQKPGNRPDLSPEWYLCNDVLHIAESERSGVDDTSLGLRCRRAYSEIIAWVGKIVAVGDVVAQIDPVHVGLPWAGLRAILAISLHDQNVRTEVAEKVADLSRLICRYAVFENVYLQDQSLLHDAIKFKLASALKTLYLAVFRYMVEVVRYLRSSARAKIGRSLLLSENFSKLHEEITKSEDDVLAYERLSIRSTSHSQYLDVRARLCDYQDRLESQHDTSAHRLSDVGLADWYADEKRKIIRDWISDIDYYSQFQDLRSRAMQESGQWVFHESEFKHWLDNNSSSLLWLRGDAGTGKTCLVSCVVEHFLEKPWAASRSAVAYFYCSKTIGDSRQQDPKAILLSVLRQLSSPMPGLPLKSLVVELYEREIARGSRQANMSLSEVVHVLSRVIEECYDKVTIIVDAMDECDANKRLELLTVLTNLTYNPKSTVQTLISSRSDPDIQTHFSKLPNVVITAANNGDDITKFVRHEIDKRLLGGRAGKDLKSRVERHLTEKANGNFRWVALQVDALCDPERVYREADIDHILSRLPNTLKETYSRILSDLESVSLDSLRGFNNTLKLMLCNEGYMFNDDLIAALTETSTASQETWSVNALLRMGRGLITFGYNNARLVFAHFSVKEFLEEKPEFGPEAANALAAEICLRKFVSLSAKTGPRMGLLERYAVGNFGRHLRDANTHRSIEPLSSLAKQFFSAVDRRAFNLWNQCCSGVSLPFFSNRAENVLERMMDCRSQPASPLFMACVYGLNEFVDSILSDSTSQLDQENSRGLRPLEVAARYGNYGTLRSVFEFAVKKQPASIRANEWLDAASRSGDLEVWSYTIQNVSNVSFVRVLALAAGDPNHGKEMVESLLMTSPVVDEGIFCDVLEICASSEVLEAIRTYAGLTQYTESMLKYAIRNSHLNPILTTSILSENNGLTVSMSCFLSALSISRERHWTLQAQTIKILLGHSPRCDISEEIIRTALINIDEDAIEILDSLLEHCHLDEITEDLLVAAVNYGNDDTGKHFSRLLTHDLRPLVSRSVLSHALMDGYKIFKQGSSATFWSRSPKVSIDDLYILINSSPYWHETFPNKFSNVLNRCDEFIMTGWFLENCLTSLNLGGLKQFLCLKRAIPISNEMVCAAAMRSKSAGVFRTLLDLRDDPELDRSENLMLGILSRYDMEFEDDTISFLDVLVTRRGSLDITEKCLTAAAHSCFRTRVIEYFMSQCNMTLQQVLVEPVIQAAAESSNLDVLEFFKLHQPNFRVSKDALEAALRQKPCNGAIVQLLLSQQDRHAITKSMVNSVVQAQDAFVLQLVMEQPDAIHFIDIVREMSSNEGKDSMDAEGITASYITDHLSKGPNLRFGARHTRTRADLGLFHDSKSSYFSDSSELNDALSKYQGPALDTSHMMELAVRRADGKYIAQFLFQRFPSIHITERALQNAAENTRALPSLLDLLLGSFPEPQSRINSRLIATAARNEACGTQMVELLLEKLTPAPKVESEVVIAALQNKFCGLSLFRIFINMQPDMEITGEFVDAAADNVVIGSILMQELLRQALVQSSRTAVESILRKLESIENGLRDALFMAVCYNHDTVLDFLLSRDVPLTTVSGELGTALNVAVQAENHNAVVKLLAKGCDIECRSRLHGSPLEVACTNGRIDILQTLIDNGADTDNTKASGAQKLRMALRNEELKAFEAFLILGVPISETDAQGMTALHHAALCTSSSRGLDRVLELGADPDARDSHEWTALHWAAKRGATENATRLLKAGSARDAVDGSGRTPLDVAVFCGNVSLAPKLALPGTAYPTVRGTDWEGVCCDACELDIRGERFKCRDCPDYDLCFRCIHDAKAVHDADHEFSEM